MDYNAYERKTRCGTRTDDDVVWVVVNEDHGVYGPYTTKQAAQDNCVDFLGEEVHCVMSHGLLPPIC